jgi:hypothetical protein
MLFDDKPMIEIVGHSPLVNYLWSDMLKSLSSRPVGSFTRSFGVVNFWWELGDRNRNAETS